MAASPAVRRGAAALLVLGSLAVAAPGCGGDDETTAPPIRPTPADATPTQTESTTTESTESTEQTATSGGGVSPTEQTTTSGTTDDDSGGGVGPSSDPDQPDSTTNDVAPEPGTPQGNFEQYCNENPGACGD